MQFKDNWHIGAICEHLQALYRREIRRLLINVPPRSGKSMIVSVMWPTWVWSFDPAFRWLFNSYQWDLSARDARWSRGLIQSTWYQDRWGHIFKLRRDQDRQDRYENNKMGYRVSTSVSGANTGEGGDGVVYDDPHNVRDVESETMRQQVLRWHGEIMSTRFTDPSTYIQCCIMQRSHDLDISGLLLEEGGWHHLCLPARYEPRRYYAAGEAPKRPDPQPHDELSCPEHIFLDPRTEPGELMWPDQFPAEVQDRIEHPMGPYAISGQMQQRPVPREGALFKTEYFQPLPHGFNRLGKRVIQYWDLAYRDNRTTDYTVGLTLAVDDAQRCYVLDVIRTKVLEGEPTAHVIAAAILRWAPDIVGIERDKFRLAAVRDTIRLVHYRLGSRIRGKYPEVYAIRVIGNKEDRAKLPSQRGEAGFLFADRQRAWWPILEYEVLRFPMGAHDDQVDALSGAMQIAVEGRIRRPPQQGKMDTSAYRGSHVA